MRGSLIGAAAAAVFLTFAGPVAGQQTRGNQAGWWPWAGGQWESGSGLREDRARGDDREDQDDDDDRDDRGVRTRGGNGQHGDYDRADRDKKSGRKEAKNGKGPKFCQNGQGHPVKGMEWCREKGFASGWD